MKYLVPFWWWDEEPEDIGYGFDAQLVVIFMIAFGIALSLAELVLAYFGWFNVYVFLFSMSLWLVPNYTISYSYYVISKDEE